MDERTGDDGSLAARPTGATARVASIDPRMVELLACPLTKGVLRYDRSRNELISKSARLAYPIRDGIPIMLASEARHLSEEERA